MNLVAKEYVACQVRAPGVLILSRLAGAATGRFACTVEVNQIDSLPSPQQVVPLAITMGVTGQVQAGNRLSGAAQPPTRAFISRLLPPYVMKIVTACYRLGNK